MSLWIVNIGGVSEECCVYDQSLQRLHFNQMVVAVMSGRVGGILEPSLMAVEPVGHSILGTGRNCGVYCILQGWSLVG